MSNLFISFVVLQVAIIFLECYLAMRGKALKFYMFCDQKFDLQLSIQEDPSREVQRRCCQSAHQSVFLVMKRWEHFMSPTIDRVGKPTVVHNVSLNSMQAWLTTARDIFHIVENFVLLAKE